jgi:hypothetical protein
MPKPSAAHEEAPPALIVPENFIQATRDSGYKTIGSALAELIDNAFEAQATIVSVAIGTFSEAEAYDIQVVVSDNGRGMDGNTLAHALQFGWSSRFNQRNGHGRYGMGLPNSSLSHAGRVEVYSARRGKTPAGVFLDVDDVASGRSAGILSPKSISRSAFRELSTFSFGTVIVWRKCDRLYGRRLGPLCRRLRTELGRLFRYQLWAGKRITVNSEAVLPFDPLFERGNGNLRGARAYGPELTFKITLHESTSLVCVRFTELPIEDWHSLSNEEKNSGGIAKNAGVSIVRAGREIDQGWFFMGRKRKENYDDWWRCEIRFEPQLDELFGVTHTKQEIHPTEGLLELLVPDMERIARELNARARKAFVTVKRRTVRRDSEKIAERHDNLIEPPRLRRADRVLSRRLTRRRGRVPGLEYRLKLQRLDSDCLYQTQLNDSRLTVLLNEAHPFVKRICSEEKGTLDLNIELMILAAARAEVTLANQKQTRAWREQFRQSWSNILTTYLT